MTYLNRSFLQSQEIPDSTASSCVHADSLRTKYVLHN